MLRSSIGPDGLEVTKQTGGLVGAQPMVLVTSQKKGSLVKPNLFQVKSNAQSSWVVGESSRGRSGDSELSVRAAVSELELCAFALNADPVHVILVVSPLFSLEGDNPDEAVSATEAPTCGFIKEAASSKGMVVEIQSPMAGISKEGCWQGRRGLGRLFLHLNGIRVQPKIIFLLCWVWVVRRAFVLGR